MDFQNKMSIKNQKEKTKNWFESLRDQICVSFEGIENDLTGINSELNPGSFKKTKWYRDDDPSKGGGTMAIMKGRVFEKVGVNISTVYGEFSPEFAKQMPGADKDPRFWASGISLVAHMHNPKIPAVHMNTRHIVTTKNWFGGGADLNAALPNDLDTKDFKTALKNCCDRHNDSYYERYKKWCDEYFYIPHRNCARGEGGVFYDQLNSGSWDADFSFTQDIGRSFNDIYPSLVRRHMNKKWTEEEREKLLYYRGLYAEFNLVYDRGTAFGLKTGGNVDAILMSLPPHAKWK